MTGRSFIAVLLITGSTAMAPARYPAQAAGEDQGWTKVLELAKKYCARLDKAALDVVHPFDGHGHVR